MKRHSYSRVLPLVALMAIQLVLVLALVTVVTDRTRSSRDIVEALAAVAALFLVELPLVALPHRAADRRARKNRLLGEFASEVNRAILLNEDEGKVFSTVLHYAFQILENVNLGSILALNEINELVIVASQGFSEDFVRQFRLPLKESFQFKQSGGRISEAMIIRPDIIKGWAHRLDSSSREYKSIISVPLFVGGKLYGFLNVDSVRPNCFGLEDLDILRNFGSQIEVCLLARERYRASLAESRIDGLTGFISRAFFDQLLGHSLEHARRYKGRFSLGMFDADGLKAVNDAFGHSAGDRYLKAIAEAIGRAARKSDVLGRFGGDEFVGIFYRTDAQAMAERARQTRAELGRSPLTFGKGPLAVSFSYGFADFPADAESLEELFATADSRLYAMKSEWKGRKRGFRG